MDGRRKYTAKIMLRVSMEAYEEDDAVEIISDLLSPGEFYGVTIDQCELSSIEEGERK